MKAGLSLNKRFVPTWRGNNALPGGEQMIAVISMPEVGDLFQLLDRLAAMGFKKGDNTKVTMGQAAQLANEAGFMVPKYVAFENAEDFTVADGVKYPPYFPLATELLFAMVEFAQLSETDEKN